MDIFLQGFNMFFLRYLGPHCISLYNLGLVGSEGYGGRGKGLNKKKENTG